MSVTLLGLLFFVSFAFADTVQEPVIDLQKLEAAADAEAEEQLAAGTPGMSVAVARNGEIIFARGYGKANVEVDAPATVDSVYGIGSVSKQFTAAAILHLAEKGELSLEDPLSKYIPTFPRGDEVTIRNLLNHTAGIVGLTRENTDRDTRERFKTDLTDDEIVALRSKEGFEFDPGSSYNYSNTGYVLLGVIISKITGTSYADYVEQKLLKPLGLVNSYYCDPRRVIPDRATGYEVQNGTLVHPGYVNIRVQGGAGALCSSVTDLVRWSEMLHEGEVVSADSLRQMTSPVRLPDGQIVEYGMGLRPNVRNGRRAIHHGGSINGFKATLAHYPDDGVTIAVLMNAIEGKADDVEKTLARTVFGNEIHDLPLTAAEMRRYEGTYRVGTDEEGMDVRVYGNDGALMLEAGETLRLRYQGGNDFVPDIHDESRITFVVIDGRAEKIVLNIGPKVHEGRRTK